MMNEKINAALKKAMLARDEFSVAALRGLKSAILNAEIEQKKRDQGLSDEEILKVIAKQVKQRDDAIALYCQAGENERAEKEKGEREILAKFLPEQMSDVELRETAQKIVAENNFAASDIGRAIGAVKKSVGAAADGARVAKIVKEVLA